VVGFQIPGSDLEPDGSLREEPVSSTIQFRRLAVERRAP
jgi:hypothetical protein